MQEAKPCSLQLGGRSQESFHQVMLFCPFAPALHQQELQGSICLPLAASKFRDKGSVAGHASRPWGEQQSRFLGNNSPAQEEEPKDP